MAFNVCMHICEHIKELEETSKSITKEGVFHHDMFAENKERKRK